MKHKYLALIVSSFLFFINGTTFEPLLVQCQPTETAFIKLDNVYNWKEINRYVTDQEGVVECIPVNQTLQNWTELLCIQYANRASFEKGKNFCIENIVNKIRDTCLSSYPQNTITWKFIEKNKNAIIYEWVLDKQHNDIPPQHEIARAFLTETGFHRIGITYKNKQFNLSEKEKWIGLLKETAIIPLEKASTYKGLSLVDKFKNSLILGSNFQNWEILETYTYDFGYAEVCRVPPFSTKQECLIVSTVPQMPAASMDLIFEIEKKNVQKDSLKSVDFQIIKKASNEIIYTYSYPKDNFQLNAVVRSLFTDQGYCTVSYRQGVAESMKKEEVKQWQEKLESIQIGKF